MQPPRGFHGIWRDDDLARAVYSEGAGITRILPRAVAVPADAEDAAALVRWAHETRAPLVPRGSGSGMAAGAIGDGVVVDLSRLRDIAPVDVARRRISAGPGALRNAVDAAARAHGLRFPVDPSSGAFCTVGGMASTNAAGAHSLRFGATRAWVTALDCIFDDGTRALVRRGEPPPTRIGAVQRFLHRVAPALSTAPPRSLAHGVSKEASGYSLDAYLASGDLVDLLVGSEGTLVILVGVELALAPLPGATSSVLAAFTTLEAAVDAARGAREHGASTCELLERTFLDVAALAMAIPAPPGAEAVLLMEAEGESAAEARATATALGDVARRSGATQVTLALRAPDEEALWALRHAASPTLARLEPGLASMQFIEDACVPLERLPDYVRGVRDALARHGIRGVIFGHAGDANVHVNPLVNVHAAGWRDRVLALLDEVTGLVARLGGTLTGEHGDGRLRTPLLERVWSDEARAAFALVKESFDPHAILNPGVKVPLPHQTTPGAIRYDPSIPPLPSAARVVLERVERERAWHRFRLEMLAEAAG